MDRIYVYVAYGRVQKSGFVSVKVKFTLEQDTKAQSWSTGLLYSFFKLGAR